MKHKNSIFIIVMIFISLFSSPPLIKGAHNNLRGIKILQEITGNSFPWSNLQWWTSICLDPLPFSHNQETNTPNRLIAYAHLLNGDCKNAIRSLVLTTDDASDAYLAKVLLAYSYAMTGRWGESVNLLPIEDFPVTGNWALRNYWANVYMRAGLSANRELIQESELLFGAFRPVGDLDLYEYWLSQGDSIAVFEELRRAISSLDEASSYDFVDEYQVLAKAFVTAQASANPNLSERWQHLKNQFENATPFSTGIDNMHPENVLDYQWDEQWVLWGVDLDKDELALGPFVHVTLYWLRQDETGEFLTKESRLMRNYVPDAGFEWGIPVNSVRPFSYNALYNNKYPYPYEIPLDGDEQIFCLLNDPETQNTGIQTSWLPAPITSNRFLVGGEYRTEQGGKAILGLRWRKDDGEVINTHVVSSESSSQWQSAKQIIQISDEAQEVSFQLVQFRNSGTACFDNLFMFAIDGPGHEVK